MIKEMTTLLESRERKGNKEEEPIVVGGGQRNRALLATSPSFLS
jgi:hypothetical protein